ncbi:TetR/AcrR family transcriptional regulator [Bifidobacterium phasiani]|uniref:TetR/AcrR family transcriptional regulator n=1 Tax=Bifidobacterium phasiani TaxID=2834431 RepID=A0ABS6W9S3_9BIFI|nr:TetR/AcrR family transcriptional regulator [Bifidobacterium phasiani]MBW3083077.1 TetR/AcrR family transcriptional regulator [Bifidobacterium phasiani]
MVRRQKRIRKDPEDRKREITQAAARLISERGFNGISLKDVADEVGMSQPGLLHYVGNKDGLLSLLITDIYDAYGTPGEFLATGLPGSDPDGPLFPAYLRYLVRHNANRRMMVQLYMVLETEAFNPSHPLHDYFRVRPASVWEKYSEIPWRIPPEMGSWNESMDPVVRQCIEAMDGIQLRWLREPPIDLYDEWLVFEKLLFPSPIWDHYR